MIHIARLFSTLIFLVLCLTAKLDVVLLFILLLFFITLKLGIPVAVKDIIRQNLFIISFILFYLLFGFLSSFISRVEPAILYQTAGKIFIAYNIIRFSVRWIGNSGMLYLIRLLPSERLKLYLILTIKGIYLFKRNSDMIIMQIKSRLESSRKSRRIIISYYTRNLIFKELYSLQYLQASIYMRLPEQFEIYAASGKACFADGVIICLLIVLIVKIHL